MIFKKKFFLLTLFLIIIFQTLLNVSNNQKSSLKFFKWTVQELSIGKLINISFFSGLFLSTLLNKTITGIKNKNIENVLENPEPFDNEEEFKSNIEIKKLYESSSDYFRLKKQSIKEQVSKKTIFCIETINNDPSMFNEDIYDWQKPSEILLSQKDEIGRAHV